MPRAMTNIVFIGGVLGLAACANLNTISRTTLLEMDDGSGKAVHLDVQQRLLIVNNDGIFCAEPSPDALAAYAASLGLGASAPGTGAASAAGGQQSSAASIGLRTQSITLMRDALYRMCEAYANQALGPAQIATLLGRSQDLTAVILAVEQLTGAVAANQVALTGTTTADASATALATSELLDTALANEARKQKSLEQATEDLVAAKAERDAADRALKAAQAKRTGLPNNASQTMIDEADAEVAFRQAEFDRAQRSVVSANERVKLRQTAYDNAQRTREAIQENQDAAIASASAATSSSAQFSTPLQRNVLDKGATEAIAIAVRDMVTEVLRKEYTQDSCMAILTDIRFGAVADDDPRKDGFDNVRDLCIEVISQSLVKLVSEATYGKDDSSVRIKAALEADAGLKKRLTAWLRGKGFTIGITTFRLGTEYAALRKLAIKELSIP